MAVADIDAILYINLAHRTDRNEHVLNEIAKLTNDAFKIHRIEAVYHDIGMVGCAASHVAALKYALEHPEWRRVLVLEDDFTFRDELSCLDIQTVVAELIAHDADMDVGLLSHGRLSSTVTASPNIRKVYYSQTTSSYLVQQHYIPKLLADFGEALASLERDGVTHDSCIDIHWTRLQPIDRWYATFPSLGIQYPNYSDVEKRNVSYV